MNIAILKYSMKLFSFFFVMRLYRPALACKQMSFDLIHTRCVTPQSGLSANSATVRAAAASCAGRLCGCISETESQALSERVITLARTSANRPVRAAAAAAVGAVQRARGAASSAAALPVLRALAQDSAAVEVQVCGVEL